MRTRPLPVRPEPGEGEPLSMYAVRLAEANGVTLSRVLARYRHDIDIPSRELTHVASLADLGTADVARLTMNRYPLAIRGHGPQRRHGWRLHHSTAWICPSCTPMTGRRDLLWQTALMPVCLRCRCYLVAAHARHITVPAHPRALELAEFLGGLAEASIDEPGPRAVLYRLRRRCQQLADTITTDQLDPGVDLPPVDLSAARAWGAYPAPDPMTVAAILILTGRRLGRKKRTQPVHLRRRQAAEFTKADRDRLAWFLTRLRHHTVHDGLRPKHVPSMLPMPATVPARGPGAWLSLARAAAALHMLTSEAVDQESTPEGSMAALRVPGLPSCVLIDGVHAGSGLREQDQELLLASLEVLITDGLVDYQRRRDTLRTLTRLPTSATRRLPRAVVEDPEFGQLATALIWTRFTHGPMRSSPWPAVPDRDVHAFDKRIDPETRLILHETGQQLLAEADLVEIPTTRTTWASVTRRYG